MDRKDERLDDFKTKFEIQLEELKPIEYHSSLQKLSGFKKNFNQRLLWLTADFLAYFSKEEFAEVRLKINMDQKKKKGDKSIPKSSIPLRSILEVRPTTLQDQKKYNKLSKTPTSSFKVVFVKKNAVSGFYKPNDKDIELPVEDEEYQKMWSQAKQEWFFCCNSSDEAKYWVNHIAMNVYKKNKKVSFDQDILRGTLQEYKELEEKNNRQNSRNRISGQTGEDGMDLNEMESEVLIQKDKINIDGEPNPNEVDMFIDKINPKSEGKTDTKVEGEKT